MALALACSATTALRSAAANCTPSRPGAGPNAQLGLADIHDIVDDVAEKTPSRDRAGEHVEPVAGKPVAGRLGVEHEVLRAGGDHHLLPGPHRLRERATENPVRGRDRD